MPSRRHVLATSVAGVSALAGCSISERQYGNVQIGNGTGRELRYRLLIRSVGGLLSDPEIVYDESYRLFPTSHFRTTSSDVAPPGTYEVEFTIEDGAPDGAGGPYTTRWEPSGEPGEALIISVGPEFDVEFLTQ